MPGQKSTDASRKIAYHWRARLRRRTRESLSVSRLAIGLIWQSSKRKAPMLRGQFRQPRSAESQSAAQHQQQVQPKDEDKKE